MKKKFFEPIFFYIETSMLFLIFVFGCAYAPVALGNDGSLSWLDQIICAALIAGIIWIFGVVAWPRMDWFTVTDTYAEWRCFLRHKRRIYYADCRYIGVETFNKEARRAIIRGDECAAVYLSMDPFPEELKGRINHLRCSDRIIKFRYTDALAEAILEVAPKEKTYLLRAFYNQMQNADRQREQQRKQRKKRVR